MELPVPTYTLSFFTPLSMVARPAGRAATLLGLMFLVTGCPFFQLPTDNGTSDVEPNDTFDQAVPIALDANGHASISGTINSSNDVDVYSLGEFNAGDRIVIDVGTNNNRLDADAAVFDQSGELVYENDDRNYDLNQLDPFINFVFRHNSSPYYVAIATSPLNDNSADQIGDYDIAINVTRGGTVPATASQIVVLDDNGGSATIGGTTYNAKSFDTADIAAAYAGMTEAVLSQIITTIQQNFDGMQLQVLVASRDGELSGCVASTVLLGGSSADAYGLSEQIDFYNQDLCDKAIIFTDLFTPRQFDGTLTATELGTAIGNVATHEIGHLLGLNHVDNPHDLMDTTGGADTFLWDQTFMTSVLDDTIFPIGAQDGAQLLSETLAPQP